MMEVEDRTDCRMNSFGYVRLAGTFRTATLAIKHGKLWRVVITGKASSDGHAVFQASTLSTLPPPRSRRRCQR
jgi:hypothetical protein